MAKYSFLLIVCMFVACTAKDINDPYHAECTEEADQKMQSQIDAINLDTQAISIRCARQYIETDLQCMEGKFTSLPDKYQIASAPRIIWGYDSRPKYYEFDIFDQYGKKKAMITTFAQKEEDAHIAYIFDYPLEHPTIDNLQMFEGLYPHVYWGKLGTYGEAPIYLQDCEGHMLSEIPSIEENERYEKIISYMDKESATSARQMLSYNIQQKEKRKNVAKKYWDQRKYNEEYHNGVRKVNGVTDKDLTNGVTPTSTFIIPGYDNDNLIHTHWSGDCGPSAIAWIYRGLYSHYPKNSTLPSTYIRIKGDGSKSANINGQSKTIFYDGFILGSENYLDCAMYWYSPDDITEAIHAKAPNNASSQIDNGLYADIHSYCASKLGDGYPLYQAGMNNAVKKITNNEYRITTTASSRNHIKNNKLPVIILYATSGSFHYIVAFGTGTIGNKDYVYVQDNGYFTSGNRYRPYWKYEGSNYGIRYKLCK